MVGKVDLTVEASSNVTSDSGGVSGLSDEDV
jgi:hypothetical protein